MDSTRFDVVGESVDDLPAAFRLRFQLVRSTVRANRWAVAWRAGNGRSVKWSREPGEGLPCLIFLSYGGDTLGAQDLPGKLGPGDCARLAAPWLKLQHERGVLPAVDFDGTRRPGWRVFVESYGHVAGEWGAILAVQPWNCLYSK